MRSHQRTNHRIKKYKVVMFQLLEICALFFARLLLSFAYMYYIVYVHSTYTRRRTPCAIWISLNYGYATLGDNDKGSRRGGLGNIITVWLTV